jgi:hypothetical protein
MGPKNEDVIQTTTELGRMGASGLICHDGVLYFWAGNTGSKTTSAPCTAQNYDNFISQLRTSVFERQAEAV